MRKELKRLGREDGSSTSLDTLNMTVTFHLNVKQIFIPLKRYKM